MFTVYQKKDDLFEFLLKTGFWAALIISCSYIGSTLSRAEELGRAARLARLVIEKSNAENQAAASGSESKHKMSASNITKGNTQDLKKQKKEKTEVEVNIEPGVSRAPEIKANDRLY